MVELRAYALAVAELRGVVGATGAHARHLRTLAGRAFAPPTRRPAVRDVIGPIHRRVPGAPVVGHDDPTPADLDALLAGTPVTPARAAATWRLLEAIAAGLAWGASRVADVDRPAGLLAPTGLELPRVDGLSVGWCPLEEAAAVPGLRDWLAGSDAWTEAAGRARRPRPDVLVFRT